MKRTRGSETSQYPEEEKSKEIPSVAASEGGRAQTDSTTKKSEVKMQSAELRKDRPREAGCAGIFSLLHSAF
jgi:hypothetical protein